MERRTWVCISGKFQSTRSARSATLIFFWLTKLVALISIHALREERDLVGRIPGRPRPLISIHALREERDDTITSKDDSPQISIHALREERDMSITLILPPLKRFQSTRSARSATLADDIFAVPAAISIHALREERDFFWVIWIPCRCWISIHALREERDLVKTWLELTPPRISIHALREERDPAAPLFFGD